MILTNGAYHQDKGVISEALVNATTPETLDGLECVPQVAYLNSNPAIVKYTLYREHFSFSLSLSLSLHEC